MFETPQVKTDCRFYRGYKPCGYRENCDGCPFYAPQGRRILIIKLGAAGDVIRTTPILKPLRQREATGEAPCHVTWITDPIAVGLLRETKTIDRLLPYSAESCMILQSERFDLLLNFEKEPRALALAALVGADRKTGFGPAPNGALSIYNPESLYALRLGLSDELKFRQNRKTYPEIIFEMIGLEFADNEYEIGLTEKARRFGDEFARKQVLDGSAPVVGLNTGCGEVFQTKQWTFEGFAEVIRAVRKMGARPMLLGGPREAEFNRRLMAESGEGVIDSGCGNSIEEFMALVNLCDAVVTADTMAMHIAIGLKKQVVALFGPTCEQEVGMYGRGEKIVAECDHSPCYRKSCDKDPNCMAALPAAAVVAAIGRRLEALRGPGGAA